jgi:hypothetical protein
MRNVFVDPLLALRCLHRSILLPSWLLHRNALLEMGLHLPTLRQVKVKRRGLVNLTTLLIHVISSIVSLP